MQLSKISNIFLKLKKCYHLNANEKLKKRVSGLNPHTPVAQKIADELGFQRFQGEGVEFFKSDLTDPPLQIFDAHLLENTNLSPSSLHFSVGFYIKICFESDGFIAYSN